MEMVNTICYKLKKPIIYNEGTKWEKSRDEFLACYGFSDMEKQIAYIAELNSNMSKRIEFCKRQRLDFDNIEYFFNNTQEAFEG